MQQEKSNAKKMEKRAVALRLKELRAGRDMTQTQVATSLGISQQTYSKYESSDITLNSEMIKRICTFYGVSSDSLLGLEKAPVAVPSQEQIDAIVERVLQRLDERREEEMEKGRF